MLDAPALTKFTKTIPNRKSPKIEYESNLFNLVNNYHRFTS